MMEERNAKSMPTPCIEIKTGTSSQIVGLDDFIKNLNSIGQVHSRQRWYPAACTGFELELLVKVGVGLALIWRDGLVYDLSKKLLGKIFRQIEDLYAKNDNAIDLIPLKVEYDDTTIEFDGVSAGQLPKLSAFFNSLPKHLEVLETKGVTNIDKIMTPIYGEEFASLEERNEDLKGYDPLFDNAFRIWKIRCDFGATTVMYDSEREYLLN